MAHSPLSWSQILAGRLFDGNTTVRCEFQKVALPSPPHVSRCRPSARPWPSGSVEVWSIAAKLSDWQAGPGAVNVHLGLQVGRQSVVHLLGHVICTDADRVWWSTVPNSAVTVTEGRGRTRLGWSLPVMCVEEARFCNWTDEIYKSINLTKFITVINKSHC